MDSFIYTDFHSHILPGADHGSSDTATSVSQLNLLAEAGIRHVVATPHFYPNRDNAERFLERRRESADELCACLTDGMPAVYTGAEVLVCEGIDHMPGLESLCITGTSTILLEMPISKWSDDLIESVFNVHSSGLCAVLAHVDRYPHEMSEQLMSLGIRAQINVSAMCTHHSRKNVSRWLEAGWICAIGSDLHGATKQTMRDYLKACELLDTYCESIDTSVNRLLEGAVPLTPHA